MKAYEARESARRFLPGLPIYARIDGRGFSRFTKGLVRPFDQRMSLAMLSATRRLVQETHARIGYVQSDEISLVWLAEDVTGSVFFDGKIQKMCSVLAGMATAAFTRAVLNSDPTFAAYAEKLPHFDCRVIELPNKTEAANMFLWRNLDATKNAVSMACRHYYPHKEMHGQGQADQHEMLHVQGVNFNNYPAFFKRGVWVRRVLVERPFTPQELERIPEAHRPEPNTLVTRSEIRSFDLPKFSSVLNREAVIFDGAEALTL
jgi:tRNA(His) 5'-end guanylyltransferase